MDLLHSPLDLKDVIVGLLPKQIIAIIHDLMLNCLPVVTYVILGGFISNIKQK